MPAAGGRPETGMSSTNRKLTTILSADVEGYSRLMGADEEGTFATLKTFRDAVSRHIATYQGRVVNTWGDGLLAEFPSVVSAVRAAIEAQTEIAERNAGKPADMRMFYRIGINLGDVIVDGDDIYGDGVNIAARLQSEAPAGGILISNTVYDQVRNKLSVGFEFLGNLDVKNIDEAVPAFSVRVGGVQQPADSPAMNSAPSGRGETPAANAASRPVAAQARGLHLPFGRTVLFLALLGGLLFMINLATYTDTFWAKWPILVFAAFAGLIWSGSRSPGQRMVSSLAVVGLFLATINLFTWSGYFWALWPLLALALVAGSRLILGTRG